LVTLYFLHTLLILAFDQSFRYYHSGIVHLLSDPYPEWDVIHISFALYLYIIFFIIELWHISLLFWHILQWHTSLFCSYLMACSHFRSNLFWNFKHTMPFCCLLSPHNAIFLTWYGWLVVSITQCHFLAVIWLTCYINHTMPFSYSFLSMALYINVMADLL